jgi:hypothetical protein
MNRNHLLFRFGLALVPLAVAASVASAAGSFSNSLTGFTGNSTLPATQTAVAAAGFNFSDITGFEDPPGIDPTILFDSGGALFGGLISLDGGRNYIRTNDADYANHSFVAEITFVAPDIDLQDVYFGLGAGNAANFRTPDWTTPNSSVMYWGETDIGAPAVYTYLVDNGDGPFVTIPAPDLTDGTHRVRLAYEWFAKSAVFSFDFNYAGGAFVADITAPAVNTLSLYGVDGWPTEPARIFFGGDDSIVLKDFQVDVSPGPSLIIGDFNSSGTITSADWAILRANQNSDLTGKTIPQAFFLGDLNLDRKNNYADFVAFKLLYEALNGAGSFARMLSGVPEPSSLVLILLAGGIATLVGRRGGRRA